jgi:hypothetical protein|tara:strand:- start:25731 stop:26324 length:594 start_codon:yes stop_codon:yes gene_type:complete
MNGKDNTLLGLITGKRGLHGGTGKYREKSGAIPPLSTTGKITDENLKDALKIAQMVFDPSSIAQGPWKLAGSMIPVWKKTAKQLPRVVNARNVTKGVTAGDVGTVSQKGFDWVTKNIDKLKESVTINQQERAILREKLQTIAKDPVLPAPAKERLLKNVYDRKNQISVENQRLDRAIDLIFKDNAMESAGRELQKGF